MDLINRQSAINKFEPWLKVKGYSEGERNMLKAVLYELTVMPPTQPEIIYCKDCKHYHVDVWGGELGIGGMYGNIIVAHNACDRWTKDMNCVDPDGFCFLAEGRAENADVDT